MSIKEDKAARLVHANQVIQVIAAHGRQFFRQGDEVSRLAIGEKGHVWLVDCYRGGRVYTHNGKWREFSQGGTMKRLVEGLRDYICTGVPISRRNFGPWPIWVGGDGDLWGYGDEAMAAVRASLADCPAISTAPVKPIVGPFADHVMTPLDHVAEAEAPADPPVEAPPAPVPLPPPPIAPAMVMVACKCGCGMTMEPKAARKCKGLIMGHVMGKVAANG